MATVFFVVGNSALVWSSLRLARLLCHGAERWRQAIAVAGLFPTLATLVLLPLGATGWLTAGAQVVGSLLVVGAVEVATLARRGRIHGSSADSPLAMEVGQDELAGPLPMGITVALAAWTFESVFLRPRLPQLRYDDFTYHAPVVFEWLSRRSFERAAILDYHGYFPFNGELLALWYLLPFGRDGLYGLAGLTWAGLGSLAVYGLARRARAHRAAALLAATAFLGGRGVVLEAQSFASGDLALAALLLSSVAMVLPGRDEGSVPAGRLLLAGAFGGVALGTKITALPVLGALAVGVAWWGGARTRRTVVERLALLGVPVLLFGTYWYVRTWVVTGNPLYPGAVGPFWGPFDAVSQRATTLFGWIGTGEGATRRRLARVVVGYGYWGGLLGLVPLLGVAMAVRKLASRQRGPRVETRTVVFLLAVVTVVLLVFPWTPFSGTPNHPSGTLRVALRFVIVPYAIGCALLAAFTRGPIAFVVFVTLLLTAEREGTFMRTFVTPPIAVLAWLGLRSRTSLVERMVAACRKRSHGALVVSAALLAMLLGLLEPRMQSRVDEMALHVRSGGILLGEAWRWVDKLPSGSRIASFGHLRNHVYGLYGRRLQHRPVALFGDGKEQPANLHDHWAQTRTQGWWTPHRRGPNLDHFVSNLRDAQLDFVLLLRSPEGEWPAQRSPLAESPAARRVRKSSVAELWSLRPPGKPQEPFDKP